MRQRREDRLDLRGGDGWHVRQKHKQDRRFLQGDDPQRVLQRLVDPRERCRLSDRVGPEPLGITQDVLVWAHHERPVDATCRAQRAQHITEHDEGE